jgi:hypothetical protein
VTITNQALAKQTSHMERLRMIFSAREQEMSNQHAVELSLKSHEVVALSARVEALTKKLKEVEHKKQSKEAVCDLIAIEQMKRVESEAEEEKKRHAAEMRHLRKQLELADTKNHALEQHNASLVETIFYLETNYVQNNLPLPGTFIVEESDVRVLSDKTHSGLDNLLLAAHQLDAKKKHEDESTASEHEDKTEWKHSKRKRSVDEVVDEKEGRHSVDKKLQPKSLLVRSRNGSSLSDISIDVPLSLQQETNLLQLHEVRRVKWTQEEDAILLDSVKLYGPRSWNSIALQLHPKTGEQCHARYRRLERSHPPPTTLSQST